MFERYTEKAKRVLAFAKYEASQMGSDTMHSEHLMLGLIREAEDITLALFSALHVDAEEVRAEVEMMSVYQKRASAPVAITISSEVQRVLSHAVEESEVLLHAYVGTEHLLMGLLREENCMAARILGRHGVRVDSLREHIAAIHRNKSKRYATERAAEAIRELGQSIGIAASGPWLTPVQLRLVAETLENVEAEVPMAFLLFADRTRVVACTRPDFPPEIAACLEGIEEGCDYLEESATILYERVGVRPVVISFVKGAMFLLAVPELGVAAASALDPVRAAATRLAEIHPGLPDPPPGPSIETSPPSNPPYDPELIHLMLDARACARQDGVTTVEPEHLLRAMLRAATPVVLQMLLAQNVDNERLWADVAATAHTPPSLGDDISVSAETAQVLDRARDEARRLASSHLGAEHVFLAILGQEQSFAAEILARHGVNRDACRKFLEARGDSR